MKVLFATAELAPLVRVGGLAPAAAGLVDALRDLDVEVEVVLPDYFGTPLADETTVVLDVPEWAGPATARRGVAHKVGRVTLVRSRGIERPHPYVQPDGVGFPDNDRRFFGFSAAVAALTRITAPDVLHLNDWHTATALAHLEAPPPTVLTIHTLGYQGWANIGWLDGFLHHRGAFLHGNDCNPLAGGIRLADLVVTVSPTYAQEIVTPQGGFGLDGELRRRGDELVGILNGIDTAIWDPSNDPNLVAPYDAGDLSGKAASQAALCEELGLDDGPGPLVVIVSRLVEQKGIDLVVPALPLLPRLPARVAVLGDGDRTLAETLHAAAGAQPERVAFRQGYDEGLAHRLFAGGDLFLMPSRFEPCGLAQMQAMRYGTPVIATDVGGLHDTVVDVDAEPARGTGTVAALADPLHVLDALHRAVRAFSNRPRRDAMRRRGMAIDWSWRAPAIAHIAHYQRLTTARRAPPRA
ncbi:MAG: glycogen synthase [Acidimicrobiia bacterium]